MQKITQFRQQFTSLTQGLLILLILGLAVNIVQQFVFVNWSWWERSIIPFSIRMLKVFSMQDNDSWGPMFKALDYLQINNDKLLYSSLFFEDKMKFQYPLTSLLPLLFLRKLIPQLENQRYVLNILSWLAVYFTIFLSIKVFNFNLADSFEQNSQISSRKDKIVRIFLLFCLGITFYPIIRAHSLGQFQVFINGLFTLSFWLWLNKKERLTGALVGLMILMKPQYLMLGIWGILRRKWYFVIATFTVVLTGLIISISLFGLANHLDYLSVLNFLSKHGESYYPNQSINGLLNRLLFNGDNLKFEMNSFPQFNPIVYGGTLLTSCLLLLPALVGFIAKQNRGSIIDFAIISLSLTIASPIAWEHHYGILFVIYAFILSSLLNHPVLGKKLFLYLGLCYLLTSNLLSFTKNLATIPVMNILQSYLLFSALGVLGILYILANTYKKKQSIEVESQIGRVEN